MSLRIQKCAWIGGAVFLCSPTTAPRTAAALPSARFICASSRQLVQIAAAAVDRKGKLREKIERSKGLGSSPTRDGIAVCGGRHCIVRQPPDHACAPAWTRSTVIVPRPGPIIFIFHEESRVPITRNQLESHCQGTRKIKMKKKQTAKAKLQKRKTMLLYQDPFVTVLFLNSNLPSLYRFSIF